MIAGLICGRAGNHPFSGRNTFPLLGRPLMVYPVLAAVHSSEITRTFLSTDDAAMAEIGRRHGAEIIERPTELCAAGTTLEAIIEHGYVQIAQKLDQELEALVILLANAPTVHSELIDQGVNLLRADATLDAVMTVSLHNEFSPSYALRLSPGGRLEPYSPSFSKASGDAYFPDALLRVLRPARYFRHSRAAVPTDWTVNTTTQRVAPLVHEGYGDVDYPWQIPAVEEWLRRRGFTEDATPYAPNPDRPTRAPSAPWVLTPRSTIERRVLITTVPFGQADRRPIDLLEAEGVEYVINPLGRRMKEEELTELVGEFGALIAGTEPITARVMRAARHLGLISRVGIGLDNVDLGEACRRGILLAYTPEAPSPAVAELTIGLMLALLRDIPGADRRMRDGVWHRFMGRRLSRMTIGVIGVGRVGRRVIEHLTGGFPGVRVLANDLQPDVDFARRTSIHWVDKERIYRDADLVTLHLPLTPETRNLISGREIARMKPGAALINTSRGGIVNERDLAEALRSGHLGGAAIDVFEREPYSGELTTFDRCILTCHMGSMSQDCRSRMELEATEEVIRFLRNEPLERPVPENEYLLARAVL